MDLVSAENKILNWDKKDFDELVNSFTQEEIAEMLGCLEYVSNRYNDGFYYTYFKNDDDSAIVYDYIRHTIYENIGKDQWKIEPKWISLLLAT